MLKAEQTVEIAYNDSLQLIQYYSFKMHIYSRKSHAYLMIATVVIATFAN